MDYDDCCHLSQKVDCEFLFEFSVEGTKSSYFMLNYNEMCNSNSAFYNLIKNISIRLNSACLDLIHFADENRVLLEQRY